MRRIYIILFALFIFGCAVSESYRLGQELMGQRRWEEALVYLEKAVSEEPANQEYREALKLARTEAAKVVYERARQSLVGREENLLNLEQAVREAEKAQKIDPDSRTIAAFTAQLREKVNTLRGKLKALYIAADQDIQKEDWVGAADKLRQINKILPNYEDTATKLARVEQEGAKQLYQQGIELMKQEDWHLAAQAFKTVMDINPNYYDVAKLYELAKTRDSFDYYYTEGEKAGQNQNWDRAITMLTKASEYQPDNVDLQNKIEVLKSKVGQIYFTEALKLTNQNLLNKALAKLNTAKNYYPTMVSDAAYKDLLNKICVKLIERADKYAEKEYWGNAVVWLQKAEAINPDYPNLFQKLLEARDNINKRIKKSIAVFDFGSPANNKDAGKIAANKLIAYLHKNASGDLRLIERENLQSILREMQLGQTGLIDIKTAQNVGKMRGIDTFVMGDVLQYAAITTDNHNISQAKVLVKEIEKKNPAYELWLQLNPKPTPEELRKAPPMIIKEPEYQSIPYKRGVARITAMLEISYKLVDTTTGENILTNTIAGKLIKEDSYQDSVPEAGIQHDPLILPTEMEVLDELTNQKISEVGQSVLKQYQSLEKEYFDQGQLQEKRRNYELAIERYIDAIYDEKLKGVVTPITKKALENIEKLIQEK